MRIENLSKVYRTRKLGKTRAVDRLTLAIPVGEVRTVTCFNCINRSASMNYTYGVKKLWKLTQMHFLSV